MKDVRVARDLIRACLPEDLLAVTDLDGLEWQKRDYTNTVRTESEIDVLYRTKISGMEAFLYVLLEHQARPDPLMPFRILYYTFLILHEYVKEVEAKGGTVKKLPLLVPVVIYHGQQPWNYPSDIHSLIDAPRELVDRYFMQPYRLIDLARITDQKLTGHAWATPMEMALKHIHDPDMLPALLEGASSMAGIVREGGRQYVEKVLQYMIGTGEISDRQAFFDIISEKVSPEVREEVMSLAQKIRQEGVEEGIKEGILKTAISMLADGADPKFVAKHTKLSLDEINELIKRKPINDEKRE